MTPISPFRMALAALFVPLLTMGCSQYLQPDPLNKTTSIVNGTQVTRGPSTGPIASGFAATAAPAGSSFEPALGEPFDVEALVGLSDNDTALPELQGIDFGVEQSGISDIIASGAVSQGGDPASYSLSDIGQTIYFATDSSELTDRARETLRRQAAWLNVNESARVIIEGHTDERGTREYNLALGDRRASATRGYLIAVGVDEARLDKTSYGKERPVALGSDEQAWAQNRRTETLIEGGNSFSEIPPPSAPFLSEVTTSALETAPLLQTGITDETIFPLQPLNSDTSDSLTLDPLFPDQSTPPGTISYGTTTDFYSPASQGATSQGFDSTTIAPTVFDTGTTTPLPPVTATSPTRIEDVSVDDLLRDPSLIDRIGTPGQTTPSS